MLLESGRISMALGAKWTLSKSGHLTSALLEACSPGVCLRESVSKLVNQYYNSQRSFGFSCVLLEQNEMTKA